MKTVVLILGTMLLCLPAMASVDEDQPVDKPAVKADVKVEAKTDAKAVATASVDEVSPEKEVTIAEYLVGVWDMAPTKHVASGDYVFRADGTYERNETDVKGQGAGVKGEYKLYPDLKPCGIDMCLDKCGVSEWTTMFGIVRILDDGRIALQTSPDNNRPTAFVPQPTEINTILLTRRVVKE